MLVVVDGMDGSGKSTLIEGLKKEVGFVELVFPRVGEFNSDKERVVCQQVTTKVGYQLAKMRTRFIVDRLMLSNLVYNDAAGRTDSFDYIEALKHAGPVLLITIEGDVEAFTARRKDKFRPVKTNPLELYNKYISRLEEVIPVCHLPGEWPKEKLVQKAKEFVMYQETKRRESEPIGTLFMEVAELMSTRSSCLRHHVGAVLVKDSMIVSTGYNGSPHGVAHCMEVGCIRAKAGVASGERAELCRGAHAEANAIIQAARNNVSTTGCCIYSTSLPCAYCAKIIINARIAKVFYNREYGDVLGKQLMEEAGIEVVKV